MYEGEGGGLRAKLKNPLVCNVCSVSLSLSLYPKSSEFVVKHEERIFVDSRKKHILFLSRKKELKTNALA